MKAKISASGLDYLTLRFWEGPTTSFLQEADLNSDFRVSYPRPGCKLITFDRSGVWSRVYLDSNGTFLNVNPCRLKSLSDLLRNVSFVMGSSDLDPDVTRLDCCGNLPRHPPEQLWRMIYFQRKRKNRLFLSPPKSPIRATQDLGLESFTIDDCPYDGFYIGAGVSKLRCYRHPLGKGRGSRVEIQFRSDACPISTLSQIHDLLDFRPFDALRIYDAPEVFDFAGDPGAVRRFTFHKLAEEVGAHEARRLLGRAGNFSRDYEPRLVLAEDIKEALNTSFLVGLKAFLQEPQ